MPSWIDGSLYPDTEVPTSLDSLPEQVDFLARLCAAWDFGVLPKAETVADCVVEAIDTERFMILPHAEVEKYFQNKANDYQRWIRGMQRLQEKFGQLPYPD